MDFSCLFLGPCMKTYVPTLNEYYQFREKKFSGVFLSADIDMESTFNIFAILSILKTGN